MEETENNAAIVSYQGEEDKSVSTDRKSYISASLVKILTPESVMSSQAFLLRPSDVLLVGYPKSGTTWMQQILHQLKTGGDEDFEDIDEVVLTLEFALDLGQDLSACQPVAPRLFRAHSWAAPKSTGKYVVIFRSPYSMTVSHYHWAVQWGLLEKSTEWSLERFVEQFWLVPFSTQSCHLTYFAFLASWWKHKSNPNVLFVFYEKLIEDREKEVRRIAEFIGVTSESNIRTAVEKSSFKYMEAHWSKFNMNTVKRHRNKLGGLPETAGLVKHKVRSGTTTEGKQSLSPASVKLMDSHWKKIVQTATGLSSYQAMLQKCCDPTD